MENSEERIEVLQLNEEEGFDYAPIKKDILIGLINDAKKKIPFYRRTPSSLKTAAALLKDIKGDYLSPDHQFKLYQCIAMSKPKLEDLEKKMVSTFRKGFINYFPADENFEINSYRDCLKELLEAGAIPNGTTFKEVLKKNPEALYQTIHSINDDLRLDKKEMLTWLCTVQDPNSVQKAMDYMSKHDPDHYNTISIIFNKCVQVLSKIDLRHQPELSFVALETLAISYRPISDLSAKFIEETLTSGHPRMHLAKYFFNNPERIPKIYAALPKEIWTIENLEKMLTFKNGFLLSEEAEKRIWSRIPEGKFSNDDFLAFKWHSHTHELYLNHVEKHLSDKLENKISSEVSAQIQKYESKRWFWERWFGELPESIIKAKAILNAGFGYYKNLSAQQQLELLQCLNEANKEDKRTADVLTNFEKNLRRLYGGDKGSKFVNYDDISTVLIMAKEGIINTSKEFEIATQEAPHLIAECYKLFNKNNTQKDIADKAWSIMFNHSDPDRIAQAISLLATRNALNLKNLGELESSQNPLLITKASMALHDLNPQKVKKDQTIDEEIIDLRQTFKKLAKGIDLDHSEKGSNIELITDIGEALKVLTITNSLKSRGDSKKLFGYLMAVNDFDKLEKLVKNQEALTLISRIMERKMFKEIPLDLFGEEIKIDLFFENIKKVPPLSEIRKAFNFDLEKLRKSKIERILKKDFDILFSKDGINRFWMKIGERVCTEDDLSRILDKVEFQPWSRLINTDSLQWEINNFLDRLLKEFLINKDTTQLVKGILDQKKETQFQQDRKPNPQPPSPTTTAATKTGIWADTKGKEEAEKDERRPSSPSTGKK